MAKKKQGLIDRLMLGKEKSEGYARASLPSNRWELFWDIIKGRFGKLVIINLLMFLFFLPLIGLIFLRYTILFNLGSAYPFTQGFGVGYMIPPSLLGYSERIIYDVNSITLVLLPIAGIFAALGISGGAYVIRNMVWTEGIFVANDFWKGIKQNFKQVCVIVLTYCLLFYFVILSISLCEYSEAVGADNEWIFTISRIFSYVLLGFFTLVAMHMLSMSVTYELRFTKLIRNAVLFSIGLFPQSVFFLFLGTLPLMFLFFGESFILSLGFVLIIFIAFSLLFLVWTVFCQWAFDKFINDKVEGAQKNRGIYEKVKESDSGALKQYREQLVMAKHIALSSRPIKPITDDELKLAELPTSFKRDDIIKLNESKQAIIDDHAKYVEEHMSDPKFVELQKETADEEKARLDREARIAKAKRELAKRNKNK